MGRSREKNLGKGKAKGQPAAAQSEGLVVTNPVAAQLGDKGGLTGKTGNGGVTRRPLPAPPRSEHASDAKADGDTHSGSSGGSPSHSSDGQMEPDVGDGNYDNTDIVAAHVAAQQAGQSRLVTNPSFRPGSRAPAADASRRQSTGGGGYLDIVGTDDDAPGLLAVSVVPEATNADATYQAAAPGGPAFQPAGAELPAGFKLEGNDEYDTAAAGGPAFQPAGAADDSAYDMAAKGGPAFVPGGHDRADYVYNDDLPRDQMYTTASRAAVAPAPAPKGGIQLAFPGVDQWKDASGNVMITGLTNHFCLWSSVGSDHEVGRIVPNEQDCAVFDVKQLAGLTLHQRTPDDPWADGELVLSVHGQEGELLQTSTMVFKAEAINQLFAHAERVKAGTLTENVDEDGYLAAGKAPGDAGYGKVISALAEAKPAPVKSGDGTLTLNDSGQVVYQLQLCAPPATQITLTPAQLRALLKQQREKGEADAAARAADERGRYQAAQGRKQPLIGAARNALEELKPALDKIYKHIRAQRFSDRTFDKATFDQALAAHAQSLVQLLFRAKGYPGLKKCVNDLLAIYAGIGGDYQHNIKADIFNGIEHEYTGLMACLAELPDFFVLLVDLETVDLGKYTPGVKKYFDSVVESVKTEKALHETDQKLVATQLSLVDKKLGEFEAGLSEVLHDPTKMPKDFEGQLDRYVSGKVKNKALSALFKAQFAALIKPLVGGEGQPGIKDVVDRRLAAGHPEVRLSVLTGGLSQQFPRAVDCLDGLPEFFTTAMLAQVKAKNDAASASDESFGFDAPSYEEAPEVTDKAVMQEQLNAYLWTVVTRVLVEEKLHDAATAINADLKNDDEEKRDPKAVAGQLVALRSAVVKLREIGFTDARLLDLLGGNGEQDSLLLLLQDKAFKPQLFSKGPASNDKLMAAYDAYRNLYLEQLAERTQALQKQHDKFRRRAKIAGGIFLVVAGGAATAVALTLQSGGDSGAPLPPLASSGTFADHFAQACLNPTNFTQAEWNELAPVFGLPAQAIAGQRVRPMIDDMVNAAQLATALSAAPNVAYRVVAAQIDYLGESLARLIVLDSAGFDARSNYTVSDGASTDLVVQSVHVPELNNTVASSCFEARSPLTVRPLSDFASASVSASQLVSLSDGQARPLGFSHQLTGTLPAGASLRAKVTGVTNGVLLRADNSFVTGGSGDTFPVSLGDIAGLQFLATRDFQGTVSPTLVLETFDPETGQVIDHADARVSQAVNIDYVATLNAPTLSATASTVLEGQASSLDIDVFLDSGVTGVSVQTLVRNIPQGTRLTLGSNTYLATDANPRNNTVDVSNWGSGNIAVRRQNANDNGLYTMTVEAITTRAATNETTRATQSVTARFDAVSDVMNIHSNSSVTLLEGVDLMMPIRLSPTGSATDQLTGLNLNQLPAGTVVTDAPFGTAGVTQSFTVTGTGVANILSLASDWTQQQHVYLHFPPFYHGGANNQLAIGLQSTTQDGNNAAPAVSNATLTANFTPVSNAVTINSASDVTRIQGNETVPCGWSVDPASIDPDETQTFEVHGIVNGSTLVELPANTTIPTNASGIASVALAQIPRLGIQPANGFIGTLTPTLVVSSQFANLPPAVSRDAFNLTLQSAMPTITLDGQHLQTDEDRPLSFHIRVTHAENIVFSNVTIGTVMRDASSSERNFTSTLGSDSVNVTLWDLNQLVVTPPFNSGDDVSFLVTATRMHRNEVLSTQQTVRIDVIPRADVPILTVANSSIVVDEGTVSIALGLNVSLTDADGELLLPLTIEGVFHGQLSAGTDHSGGRWTVPIAEVGALSFLPDQYYGSLTESIRLVVTATSRESLNADTATRVRQIVLSIIPVANLPAFRLGAVSGVEDSEIRIGDQIFITPVDTDGSEHYELDIGPLGGGSLSAGAANNETGIWRLTQSEFDGNLTYRPPSDFAGRVSIPVSLYTYDGRDSASISGVLQVNVNPVADVPVFSLPQSITFSSSSPVVNLWQEFNISLTDRDGSETLQVIVANLAYGTLDPQGAFLGGSRYSFTEAQFRVLRYFPDVSWYQSFPQGHVLNIRAIVTDGISTREMPGPGSARGVLVRLGSRRHRDRRDELSSALASEEGVTTADVLGGLSNLWASLWQQQPAANEAVVERPQAQSMTN